MLSFIPVDFDPFAEDLEIAKITLTNEPQREIWLACMIGGREANMSYNESVSLKLTGDLKFDALKRSTEQLVARHEALRSSISANGETLIIHKTIPLELELRDISGNQTKDIFQSFLQKEINTPFDLQAAPLFKVFLHKTGPAEYYFTIIKHHIIGDGWSTGIMLEDLSKMYNAYSSNNDILLDPAYQISDYTSAQAAFKISEAYKETEDYWLDIYKGDVPVVDVPTDRSRQAPRTYKGHRLDYPLSKEMADQLKSVGAKYSCSLVTTLLAAFEIFLYKETQQDDIIIGLPSSGQAATGLDNVVGHCVNLLPLRSHIDPGFSFAEYLKKRKKEVLDAYDHQRLTFGELIKKLYIPRDPSRIPLVPVMFNIDMGMDNAVSFDGLDYKLISNPRNYENFEIYLNATGSKEGIILEWSYNTDLFDKETIEAFNKDYTAILHSIIADAETSINEITGTDQALSIAAGNSIHIPAGLTINNLINESTQKYANKTAIHFRDTKLTYKQLNEQAGQLSSLLIQKGIQKGDIVAISLDRSVEMVISMLAIMRTGAVYLPLDPEYPFERTKFMLEDSSAKLLITSQVHKNKYSGTPQLIAEDTWPALSSIRLQNTQIAINDTDIAYVLYTSGSTGKPKGVKITHRNLVNFLLSMQDAPGIISDDSLLAITSISFDIAGLELYLPLISGALLVLADTEATKDGRLLLDILDRQNITMMQATPSTWQMLIDSGWDKKLRLKMLSGGEALPQELVERLLKQGTELWNMYGPTETTIWSTIKKITPGGQVTIGKPINNTSVYIMDEHGNLLPSGRSGEICIGGEGVAEGYLNRPELTSKRFLPDAYTTVQNTRLYRTGDVGKILPDGNIKCMGRIDQQVKIRGHRIEPGEIENAIAQLPDVKQAVVAVHEHAGDKRLVAYLTLNNKPDDTNGTSWKDRWDTLYEIGAENKSATNGNIDGTLLENLKNSEELALQHVEWLQTTIERIKAINARRIYEIGCGAGQVLFELAGDTDRYIATDYAGAAINNIQQRLDAEPKRWKNVKACVATADDFSAVGDEPLDLVLINSVAQYFPNAEYFINVISNAAKTLKKGGVIFIGDMQGKNALEMYHAMDHMPRAADETTIAAFKDVVANRVKIEEELVADPAFFYQLPKLIPGITGVNVQLRKGQAVNETTKYHYDIWLYVAQPVETVASQATVNWKDINSIEKLEAILTKNKNGVVEVRNIPDSRTAKDYKLQQLLNNAEPTTPISDIRREVANTQQGIHPDSIWATGNKLNYTAHIRWTTDGTDNLFDAVFIPSSGKILLPVFSREEDLKKSIYDFIRTPLSNNEIPLAKELVQDWKKQLNTVLPGYMIPEDFIALNKFPLTPNAKIDRKALPAPQYKEHTREDAIALTENEKIVADIWSDILGLQNLHPSDDFFELGGHSLLAIKVMVAIEKQTGKRLPIATLFNHSTISKLATQLAEKETAEKWDVLVPIKTTGSKIPLFLIHGGGMNILLFRSITEHFDADQPVYGLQALGFSHKTDIPATIEEIAARYVNDILKVNPDGPYALAGYSLGGFMAFEMAKQLTALGKEIKFLGVMDTYAGNNYYAGGTIARLGRKIVRQFRKVPFYTWSFISNPKDAFMYQVISMKKRFRKLQTTETLVPEEFNEYEAGIYRRYSDALDAYLLSPLDVKITLFRVQERLYFLDDLVYLGWGRFARKGVDVRVVPGDHKTFLFPEHGKQLAGIIQRSLNEATKT